jgi:hypothetical protein
MAKLLQLSSKQCLRVQFSVFQETGLSMAMARQLFSVAPALEAGWTWKSSFPHEKLVNESFISGFPGHEAAHRDAMRRVLGDNYEFFFDTVCRVRAVSDCSFWSTFSRTRMRNCSFHWGWIVYVCHSIIDILKMIWIRLYSKNQDSNISIE